MSHVQVPAEILALPIDERIELVQLIWNSIAESTQISKVSDEHQQLLDKRLAELHERPDRLIPSEEVFRELG